MSWASLAQITRGELPGKLTLSPFEALGLKPKLSCPRADSRVHSSTLVRSCRLSGPLENFRAPSKKLNLPEFSTR